MRVAHKKDPRFREGFKSLVDSIGFFDPSRMTMKTVTLERVASWSVAIGSGPCGY